MKKLIAVLVSLALVVCLVSCGNIRTYDDGFEDGYDEGYFDAKLELEDTYSRGYDRGYDIGYDDGYLSAEDEHEYDVQSAAERADEYAFSNSEYGLYEALQIVGVKQGFMSPGEGSDIPTNQEYKDAVKTLYLFCEFFDSKMYDTSKAKENLINRIDEIVRNGG